MQDVKMTDVKLTDQFAGHEIAGRENDQCSRKRGQPLKKNVKSHVFLDFEKNVKKR